MQKLFQHKKEIDNNNQNLMGQNKFSNHFNKMLNLKALVIYSTRSPCPCSNGNKTWMTLFSEAYCYGLVPCWNISILVVDGLFETILWLEMFCNRVHFETICLMKIGKNSKLKIFINQKPKSWRKAPKKIVTEILECWRYFLRNQNQIML
jgi:hypothetical protein